ncbi:MAG: LptF/LptG family permease, partial [Candidatus Adiutrix sp.]|nr:LptF/LptG family permease [Candidatus Adiutrix sp.]
QGATDSIFFDTYDLKVSPGDDVAAQSDGGLFRGRSDTPTRQLAAAAARLESPGARLSYRLEWHERWARPAAAFIMTLIGLPLGASFRVKGRNFALLAAILVFLFYHAVSSLGWALVETGRIPPAVGVWTGNVILAVFGLTLLRRLNRGAPIDPADFLRRLTARARVR